MSPHYYNEIDPYPAQWLRNLMAAGHIPAGDVDERSITDVQSDDLRGYTQCHFFAGIAGWPLALKLAGWPVDRPVWTGSCPCQPFSFSGKRRGFSDDRHLWPAWLRLIKERRPAVLFGEQVERAIGFGWLDGVASDLENEDYAVGATVLSASSVHAPHRRDRLWFVADTERHESSEPRSRGNRRVGRLKQSIPWDRDCERALSEFRAMDDGLPRRVGATNAARNAIVPQVAAEVIAAYMECRP